MLSLNLLMKIFTNNKYLVGDNYKLDINEREGWIEHLETEEVIFAYAMDGSEITYNGSSEELIEALDDIGLL